MGEGLAEQMVYGDGKGQNTTHYYAGVRKQAGKKMATKKKASKKGKSGCKK